MKNIERDALLLDALLLWREYLDAEWTPDNLNVFADKARLLLAREGLFFDYGKEEENGA